VAAGSASTGKEEPQKVYVADSKPTMKLRKPDIITLTESTGKLQKLFQRIGYELDGVRKRGEVPRILLASLPPDLPDLPRADQRKMTFIKSTLPLILHVNEQILHQRRRLMSIQSLMEAGEKISTENALWLEDMADLYGAQTANPDALLCRVDVVPPSLAIAQAAEESGWGTSRFAREGNALFGQRIYRDNRKGLVPEDRKEGEVFRVRAFDRLIDGVKAYVHNLNSHFAYDDFRASRAAMRKQTSKLNGYDLAGSLIKYSERGAAYIETIRLIMRTNSLQVFDASHLGAVVEPNKGDDGPDT
jgi:Bax protein